MTVPPGYEIRAEGLDVDLIHHWLSTDAYWALGRAHEVVARSMENSICRGAFATGAATDPDDLTATGPEAADAAVRNGKLVGFARAVTDSATFGWVADVYVDRAHRGRGLGTRLVGALTEDLVARGVDRLTLATMDAHGVYAKLGFTPLAFPERWMELDQR
jgi:GNAT superfamily N-acetyltransferase